MKFVTGSYVHSLDAKNRIRIPKKLKDAFEGQKLYFMRYTGGCIAVYPASALEERLEELKPVKSDNKELLRAKRALLGAIEEIEEDNQGRTTLSAEMRSYAGIDKTVLTIGMGDYLELWAPERYKDETEKVPLETAYEIIPF